MTFAIFPEIAQLVVVILVLVIFYYLRGSCKTSSIVCMDIDLNKSASLCSSYKCAGYTDSIEPLF